ncbi:MAG: RagB/SusD family nutrient uptake outer membrane protein [Owenweeksia sp.]|nr:RagB/SusD family nutrient uptake outer membrane protein [Owenweeksia sp.]MBF99001.1 RagB/SusD family nutrient uptake outer membrane protein [Owenweeksia sp.]HBF20476.1 RagB/SusD family nutrient uptake outer membrane protein [Cryomorphaceae bacterium]HCQ15226.1 RagB/SusD family nutrient uptake outer membrane protein [Cryomorphaceae bacterium]
MILKTINSKLYVVLLVGLFGGMISSCKKDFMEVPPQGQLTSEQFPTSPEHALLAVNGAYGSMRNWNYNYGGFPVADILSDDARKGSNPGDGAAMNLIDQFQYTPTQSTFSVYYAALYRSILHANVVIEKVPDIAMDAELKNRYIAEARFLRAFHYFNYVRAYGDGVIVTTTSPDPEATRSPQSEIYKLIISDLEFAIETLPTKNGADYTAADKGRATRGAAQALLARTYLYMKDFGNAQKYAEDVINSGDYDLEPNFGDVFTVASEFGIESVFELGAFPQTGGFINGGNQYSNTQGVRGDPNNGWGFSRPSLDLINSFRDAGDTVRLDATVIFVGEILGNGTDTIFGDENTPDSTFENGQLVEVETYNQKVYSTGNNEYQWGNNVRYIRFAEVLLIAAEAANKNGASGIALTYLNRVRQRVGLGDINVTDQNQLDDIIFEERRHELAMEQHRFWDLVRTGRAPAVLGPLGFQEGKHELFPIPQAERDISGNRISQNPQW